MIFPINTVQQVMQESKISIVEPLPHNVQAAIRPGIEAAALKWNVQLPDGWSDTFDNDYNNRFGNRPLTPQGIDLYVGLLRQQWRFCAWIKDYESMLILVTPHGAVGEEQQQARPAMKPSTIDLMLRFKRETKDTPLENTAGIPVLDIFGKPVHCDGAWNNPQKADQLCSAISAVHDAWELHSNTQGFKEACEGCRSLPLQDRNRGCHVCVGSTGPRPYRVGNPCHTQIVKNTLKNVQDPNYQEVGNSQLTPKDLRIIRQALLAPNQLEGLAIYTMILCGCKLFARQDEVGKIEIEHFVPELFLRENGRVHALCVKIRGKSDEGEWQYRWIWADDDCPDLCPVRHLLCYIFLGGHMGGFLFPRSKEFGQDKPADGIYRTSISYNTFRMWFKKFISELLQNPDLKVGLHMWRKTAYLLGIWGGGDWTDLKVSARHKSDKEAEKYAKDALALQQLQTIFYDHDNRVGKWKSIVCQAPSQAERMAATGSDAQGIPLHQLAEEFVTNSLACPPGHLHRFNQRELLNLSMKYTCQPTLLEEMRLITQNFHLAPDAMQAFQGILNRALADQRQRLIANFQIQNAQPAQPAVAVAQFAVSQSNKRQRRHGNNDLEGRGEISRLQSVREKVEAIRRLQVPESTTDLTGAACTYMRRTITPILGCLKNHCGDDVDVFVARWDDAFVMKFSACCDGKSTHACPRAPPPSPNAS
jgi:hypothetical protein